MSRVTKHQLRVAQRLTNAARAIGSSREFISGCTATRVAGCRDEFKKILSPKPGNSCGAYWLGGPTLEGDVFVSFAMAFEGERNTKRNRNQRVIGLLLCAEFVKGTDVRRMRHR